MDHSLRSTSLELEQFNPFFPQQLSTIHFPLLRSPDKLRLSLGSPNNNLPGYSAT